MLFVVVASGDGMPPATGCQYVPFGGTRYKALPFDIRLCRSICAAAHEGLAADARQIGWTIPQSASQTAPFTQRSLFSCCRFAAAIGYACGRETSSGASRHLPQRGRLFLQPRGVDCALCAEGIGVLVQAGGLEQDAHGKVETIVRYGEQQRAVCAGE